MIKKEEKAARAAELENELLNNEFVEAVIEQMVEKGPDIDWSKVTVSSDLDTQEVTMESDDPKTEEELHKAYNLVMADQNNSLPT